MDEVQKAFFRLAPYLVDNEPDENGVIEFSGRRFVYFRTRMLSSLFDSMEDVTGPVIRGKIKEFGIEGGEAIGRKMDEDFESIDPFEIIKVLIRSGFDVKSLKKITPTDDLSQFKKILGYGAHVGWMGSLEVREYSQDEKIVFELYNTIESFSYGGSDQNQCQFVLGTLHGIMSHFWDPDELKSREIECSCVEDQDYCLMKVEKDGA
ncbi:MAG: hypothetical protein ABEK01_02500 [Candidatus Nanohaloarchaea archaeon]